MISTTNYIELQAPAPSNSNLHWKSTDRIIESKNKMGVTHSFKGVNGQMLRRRGELIRLARFRAENGLDLGDLSAWARVMADNLVFWRGGSNARTFHDLATRMRIVFPEDLMMKAIRRVAMQHKAKGKEYRPFYSDTAGEMLEVCVAEKIECDIRTMTAIDEDEAYAAFKAEAKRKRERERDQRRRASKEGYKTRAEYEDNSLSKTKPWKDLGMSKATWYRKGKPSAPPFSANDQGPAALAA